MKKYLIFSPFIISNSYAFDYNLNIESRIDLKQQKTADLNFRYHFYFISAKTKYLERSTGVNSMKEKVYAFGFKADI